MERKRQTHRWRAREKRRETGGGGGIERGRQIDSARRREIESK